MLCVLQRFWVVKKRSKIYTFSLCYSLLIECKFFENLVSFSKCKEKLWIIVVIRWNISVTRNREGDIDTDFFEIWTFKTANRLFFVCAGMCIKYHRSYTKTYSVIPKTRWGEGYFWNNSVSFCAQMIRLDAHIAQTIVTFKSSNFERGGANEMDLSIWYIFPSSYRFYNWTYNSNLAVDALVPRLFGQQLQNNHIKQFIWCGW